MYHGTCSGPFPHAQCSKRTSWSVLWTFADYNTARENQDTACLNFALSWLLHLRQVHPNDRTTSFESLIKLLGGSNEDDEITFLKAKARESKHWSLLSSTLLEEAKLEMYSVRDMISATSSILGG